MNTIDVRTIIPRERHPLIFSTFDGLAPGESFEVVNGRARRAARVELPGAGPEVRRVKVGRVGA